MGRGEPHSDGGGEGRLNQLREKIWRGTQGGDVYEKSERLIWDNTYITRWGGERKFGEEKGKQLTTGSAR